jgi:putative FmdB family regulatory protein
VPTYQYACRDCDHRFEAVQSFSDGSLTDCPACAGKLRKVFSSVGIVFKGSGFYRTDSRSGGTVGAKSESTDSAVSASPSKASVSAGTDSGSSSKDSGSSSSSSSTAKAGTSS